ncbi:hypothetical protein KXD93_06175 [Mucilaginibacter sp. BJC16-A38]|uniref:hypothetical protein n=1 Tax=Mucilaginibacter phenanthrenivorans TaxID=1234842 RepID=UPI002157A82A|nr:hypothetical protein [Mucilaginibacter phenanthrenivorans]MCR8557217.1 hypothetical protein [Mucilaginibacter phenanthrenivorans]
MAFTLSLLLLAFTLYINARVHVGNENTDTSDLITVDQDSLGVEAYCYCALTARNVGKAIKEQRGWGLHREPGVASCLL